MRCSLKAKLRHNPTAAGGVFGRHLSLCRVLPPGQQRQHCRHKARNGQIPSVKGVSSDWPVLTDVFRPAMYCTRENSKHEQLTSRSPRWPSARGNESSPADSRLKRNVAGFVLAWNNVEGMGNLVKQHGASTLAECSRFRLSAAPCTPDRKRTSRRGTGVQSFVSGSNPQIRRNIMMIITWKHPTEVQVHGGLRRVHIEEAPRCRIAVARPMTSCSGSVKREIIL